MIELSHQEIPKARLEGLMLFRVVLVTLFLGSALAVDTEALANLADFKNATIVGLIVATYVVTIIYALLLNRIPTDLLAKIQLLVDTLTTFALTLVTSGLDSVFLFLFYINIINAAVVVGRRFALYLAGLTSVLLLGLAAIDLRLVRLDQIYPILRPTEATYLRLGLNAAATFVTGLLAGQLADRLGKATEEIARQQGDIAQLRALNLNILESLSSGLVTVDSNGNIIFFNRAAREITQRSEGDVLNRRLDDIFPQLWKATQDRSGRRQELLFERHDGASFYLGYSVSPLYDAENHQNGQIIIFQDLSDIKRLESQMRRSERLAAVGQLSAAIAHEIRNPLASISGSVEMLRDASENPEDQTLMRIVLREVDRLNHLITDFLEYSRPHELKKADLEVEQIVREIGSLLGTKVSISIDCDENLRIHADEQSFRQVIWNLMNNALEASPENAVINFEATEFEESWVIAIEDNGQGINALESERIFEPFYTTKRSGTGLGLATIHRMMEEHGGNITVTNAKKLKGARFELFFPKNNE